MPDALPYFFDLGTKAEIDRHRDLLSWFSGVTTALGCVNARFRRCRARLRQCAQEPTLDAARGLLSDPGTMATTVEQLITLAAKRFEKDATLLSAEGDVFESLGIDSVQVLSLLSELESHFDVEVPDYELRDVRTFKQLAEAIERRR
jgi:acyl carrier protein